MKGILYSINNYKSTLSESFINYTFLIFIFIFVHRQDRGFAVVIDDGTVIYEDSNVGATIGLYHPYVINVNRKFAAQKIQIVRTASLQTSLEMLNFCEIEIYGGM